MIVDGEELTMVCQDCGKRFKHIIGYGPTCPTPWLRDKMLKEYPPICPNCGSKKSKRLSIIGNILNRLVRK